jgi:hypothetical protein
MKEDEMTAASDAPTAARTRRFAIGIWHLIAIVAGALVIGLAVPLFWFWVGGQLGGDFTPGEYLSPQTFAAILPGMIITYVVILEICGRIWRRSLSPEQRREQQWPVRRASWNRSMRDEAYRPGQQKMSWVETMFVVCTFGMSILFTVWFFLWAESPL